MKKLKLNGKLKLNKETVAALSNYQMNEINGGGFLSIGKVCHSNNHPTDCATTGGACGGTKLAEVDA